MKIKTIATLSILSGVLITPIYSEKVKLEQLPSALQSKIRSQVGAARIEDIDRNVQNGKTTYEVAFKNAQGQNTELVFEDTETPAPGRDSTTGLDSRKISYAELPVPVRRTADGEIKGGEVNDVERRVRNERVTYNIGFKGPNGTGPQQELVIDSQGKLLRGSRSSENARAHSPANETAGVAARTMTYNDLPQSVRGVAESHLKHGHVERVERRVKNGTIDYKLLFKKEDGQYQEIIVGEDGRLVSNRMVQTSALGSPGTLQSDTGIASGAQSSAYPSVTKPVEISNAVAVERSQVPAEVRAAIREHARNGNVEEIRKGNWSGKDVYQVAFTDENKNYREVQIDQKGQVIYDPRNAVKGDTTESTPPRGEGVLNKIGRLFEKE